MVDNEFTVTPQSLPKMPTHVSGLDEVLHGGLPEGRLTIIDGAPGTGKSVLGLEISVRVAEAGGSAIYISFEETSDTIRTNALSLGWDLAAIERRGKLALINPEIKFDAPASGDFNIDGLCPIIAGQAKRIGAKFIVLDAVDMLMRMFSDSEKMHSQLITLHRCLRSNNLTAILTVKAEGSTRWEYAYLDFMADCVINLDQRIENQVNTRRLRVVKYRGSNYASREQPFIITDRGFVVMPLSSVDLVQESKRDLVSVDNVQLDTLLGGGYSRGSAVLISGPSGSGKTTLAFTLSVAAARRGERVIYLSFEQSEPALISDMKSIGFDLEPLVNEGSLLITPIMPESLGMEEHLYRIIRQIEEYQPDHLVVDAISATPRIGSKQAATDFLIRLLHATKKRGITCIYTNQTFPAVESDLEISGAGISSLVDTAVLLGYFRKENQVARSLLVLKSRGIHHSTLYNEFQITDHGITINGSFTLDANG